MIVSGVESSYERRLFRSLELPVHIAVIGTGLGHHPQTAVLPEHPLGAKAMRRLDNGHEHGRADRAQAWDGAKQFPRSMLFTLGEEFLPCLLAQGDQRVQLLVEKLGPVAHAGLGDLAQPFLPMARVVNTLAGTRNAPAAIVSAPVQKSP